jgi:hypothetical protein
MLVVGHTDSQGSDKANDKLSAARAGAVREYLVGEGIEDDRIRSEGVGKKQPIAENTTAEGRANNRRVEIILEASPGSGHTETPKEDEGKKAKGKGKEEPKKPPAKKDEPKKEPK